VFWIIIHGDIHVDDIHCDYWWLFVLIHGDIHADEKAILMFTFMLISVT
jgi:hypothetical protein